MFVAVVPRNTFESRATHPTYIHEFFLHILYLKAEKSLFHPPVLPCNVQCQMSLRHAFQVPAAADLHIRTPESFYAPTKVTYRTRSAVAALYLKRL